MCLTKKNISFILFFRLIPSKKFFAVLIFKQKFVFFFTNFYLFWIYICHTTLYTFRSMIKNDIMLDINMRLHALSTFMY